MSSNPDEKTGSSSPASPREQRVGRGPRRGETNKNAPPLPSPLLHPMEEREKSRSLMQPWSGSESTVFPLESTATPANLPRYETDLRLRHLAGNGRRHRRGNRAGR